MSHVSSSARLCRLSRDEGPGAGSLLWDGEGYASRSFPSTRPLVKRQEEMEGPGGNGETHKTSAGLNVGERNLTSSI